MNERLIAILKQAMALWAKMSTAKRVALAIVVASTIVAGILVSTLSGRENWAYLFTDMSAEDAAAIAGKLKELKIPFKVEAGGTAVQVPEEKVHELRLELAGAGLPRGGGVGFELFDKSRLGATEFEQRINLRRALEGELSRTIGTIGAVQAARVHLVLPEQSVFAISKQTASASVVLRLRAGRSFSKGEVASVVHLVSAAVPGLAEDRVSIVSADGMTLHRPRADASHGADSEAQEEREREVAGSLEEKARAIVERVVGPGKSDVRISASLDTSSREKTEEHYEPTKTALRSEQKTEEKSGTEGATVAGVPGAQSNRADSPAPAPEVPAAGSAWRTSWTRNWEVDRVTQKTTLPPGTLAHLSIAMLVDGTYDNGKYLPRSKEEMDRLASLVKGSVGFDAARGDVLQIESAQFATADAGAVVPVVDPRAKKPFYMWAAAGAAGVVALAILVLFWRRGSKNKKGALEIEAARALAAGETPAQLEGDVAARALTAGKAANELTREKALEVALADPATAAVILKEWLNAPSTAAAVVATPQF